MSERVSYKINVGWSSPINIDFGMKAQRMRGEEGTRIAHSRRNWLSQSTETAWVTADRQGPRALRAIKRMDV
jgi:hypothetical protein